MKKNIILFIAFLIGLSIFLYPIITGYISYQNGLWQIRTYEKSIENIPEEDYSDIILEAQKYNKDLTQDYSNIISNEDKYYNQINISNTDIMGYIYIEKLNVDLPIYHGMEDGVLQVGIGHFPASSLPIGGDGTHAVLLGHRGLPTAKLFTHLDKLELGDVFTIKILKEKLLYEVDQILVVEPDEVFDHIKIEEDKDQITLVTCTPYGINTHRLLVRGTRTQEEVKEIEEIFNKNYRNNILILVTIIVVFIIIISTVITVLHQKHKKYYREKRKERLEKEFKSEEDLNIKQDSEIKELSEKEKKEKTKRNSKIKNRKKTKKNRKSKRRKPRIGGG